MKITTKGRYAIHILYDLAVNGTEHGEKSGLVKVIVLCARNLVGVAVRHLSDEPLHLCPELRDQRPITRLDLKRQLFIRHTRQEPPTTARYIPVRVLLYRQPIGRGDVRLHHPECHGWFSDNPFCGMLLSYLISGTPDAREALDKLRCTTFANCTLSQDSVFPSRIADLISRSSSSKEEIIPPVSSCVI